MCLLGYHLFVSYVLGYGDGDLVLAENLINQELAVSLRLIDLPKYVFVC